MPLKGRQQARRAMDELKEPLANYLLSIGDDELVLGQRDSEWCGQAPILEEDIAFANIALDEIGHAAIWYGLLAELTGEDTQSTPDRLVFTRSAREYRNIQMVELPKGDWAFSMLRQFFFDTAELLRLEALTLSRYAPLASAAAKIRREEIYHHRHTYAWVLRLGQGTQESHRRTQAALEELWPYTPQMFRAQPPEDHLAAQGICPSPAALHTAWEAQAFDFFHTCGLNPPDKASPALSRQEHTYHLEVLLAEMQSVARMDAGAEW